MGQLIKEKKVELDFKTKYTSCIIIQGEIGLRIQWNTMCTKNRSGIPQFVAVPENIKCTVGPKIYER